jgi:hypothetical protein
LGGIAFRAFFGGRSEISCIGPVPGPVYGYDINSAYPTAIADLPELSGARWYRVKKHKPGMWGFYRIRWSQRKTECWGMFPIRGAMLPDGHRSISLMYPNSGEGWFHSHEVETAIRLNPGAVEIWDGWVIEDSGARPFEWVKAEAAIRLAYKAAGDERAFPLKVGLNSVYGKLAQRSGTHPLQCIAYAASITSWTRAQLLSAAYPAGHGVILLATDGILSTVPLDLPLGAGLGTWEADVYESAWMLQAGVYWAGGKKKTRGIDARTLTLDAVADRWRRHATRGVLELPSRRVLSYRLCTAQRKLHLTGTWYDGLRKVKFSPSPRRRSHRWDGDRLLTIPARTVDYKEVAETDAMLMALDDMAQFSELEALPDWAIPE